jgi:hypothetical protein
MKALITGSGQLGPFMIITELSDRWVCDGIEYQHNVVGSATVGDWVTPVHTVTTDERAALLKKIDADTDAIYLAVQGNRGPEYQLAETDAIAYKAAGYTGTVPASVQSWATAKAQTAQWSADDILTTATAWRGAQASIRANRLARKEAARTASDLSPVTTQWDGFVKAIKTALGVS